MNKNVVLILVFIFSNFIAHSQSITISGFLTDSSSNEVIIGGLVRDLLSDKNTISNEYGFYSIKVPYRKKIILQVQVVGYHEIIDTIFPVNNKIVKNYTLSKKYTNIKQITISKQKDITLPEISMIDIKPEAIKVIPALFGESDVFRALQMMPGIDQGDEGKSGLYIRGSSPAQNQILLDDVVLFNVSHVGGFLSVFNNDAIKDIKIYKGVYPSIYGNSSS